MKACREFLFSRIDFRVGGIRKNKNKVTDEKPKEPSSQTTPFHLQEDPQFPKMLSSIAEVYVGKAEELRKIVKLMCGAVTQSMKAAKIQVPPWRRRSFMEAKWFSPYKRTVNYVSSEPNHLPVKREVGFGAGIPVIGRADNIVKVRVNGGGLGSKVSRLTTMLEA
ncbi:hypothetical protein LINPERPRIM_LOCUS23331 [Linum perenne]